MKKPFEDIESLAKQALKMIETRERLINSIIDDIEDTEKKQVLKTLLKRAKAGHITVDEILKEAQKLNDNARTN